MERRGVKELDELLSRVPEEIVREIEEYEREERARHRASGSKRPFPSNEDVVDAIKEVCGGVITRDTAEHLFEAVKRHLEEKGFDTRFLTEGRFWRLVTNLVKKGILKVR